MQTDDKVQMTLSYFMYSKTQNATEESFLMYSEEHFLSISANISTS